MSNTDEITPAKSQQGVEESDNVVSYDKTKEHPLQHVWTLHYDSGYVKGQEWGASIKPVANLETVEEFWRLYNNIIS